MNVETANRLQMLRKQNNLSQEELAEKLGISRQAVSKWERAEASPDTDNLISLAKLYGVTLDELLRTENKSAPVSSGISLKKEDYSTSGAVVDDDGEIYPQRRSSVNSTPQGAPGTIGAEPDAEPTGSTSGTNTYGGDTSGAYNAGGESAKSSGSEADGAKTTDDFVKNVAEFTATVTEKAMSAAAKGLAEANKRMSANEMSNGAKEEKFHGNTFEEFGANFEEFGRNIERKFNEESNRGYAEPEHRHRNRHNSSFETAPKFEAPSVESSGGCPAVKSEPKEEPSLFNKLFALIVVAAYFFFSCTGAFSWKYSWLMFFIIPLYYIGVKPVNDLRKGKIGFFKALFDYIDGALPVGITFLYLFFGLGANLWHPGWMMFFLIPLYYTTKEAILKRNLLAFCFPVVVTWAYLVLGFAGNWIIGLPLFATIPFYYIIVDHFRKKKKRGKNDKQ